MNPGSLISSSDLSGEVKVNLSQIFSYYQNISCITRKISNILQKEGVMRFKRNRKSRNESHDNPLTFNATWHFEDNPYLSF